MAGGLGTDWAGLRSLHAAPHWLWLSGGVVVGVAWKSVDSPILSKPPNGPALGLH